MMLCVVLHMGKVFWHKAYRAPRELTWVAGTLLLFLTMAFFLQRLSAALGPASVLGDHRGDQAPGISAHRRGLHPDADAGRRECLWGDALSVLHSPHGDSAMGGHFPDGRPFRVGPATRDIKAFVAQWGGERMGDDNEKGGPPLLTRFMSSTRGVQLHIWIGIVLTLAVLAPISLHEQADPLVTPEGIKPEWYFLPMYQFLKYIPGDLEVLGVLLMAALSLALVAWPALDAAVERKWPNTRLTRVLVGVTTCPVSVHGSLGQSVRRAPACLWRDHRVQREGDA